MSGPTLRERRIDFIVRSMLPAMQHDYGMCSREIGENAVVRAIFASRVRRKWALFISDKRIAA